MSDWKSLDSMTDEELNQYIASLESETFGTEFEEEQEETPVEAEPTATTNEEEVTEAPVEEPTEEAFNILKDRFVANGVEFDLQNPDDLGNVLALGKQYLQDKPQLEKVSKIQKVMDKLQLSPEDFNLLLEARQGNRKALTKLMTLIETNPYELDLYDPEIDEYKPKDYLNDPTIFKHENPLADLAEHVKDQDIFDQISTWDKESLEYLRDHPNVLQFFQFQKKNGIYDKVMQTYQKKRLLGETNGFPDYQVYFAIADEIAKKQEQSQTTSTETKPMNQSSYKKKQASIPRGGSTKPQADPTEFRILTGEEMTRLSDEDLDQYQRDLEQYLASYS